MNTTRQHSSSGHLFLKIFTFIVVFLPVVLTSTIITFILPETYASTVRIHLEPHPPAQNGEMSYGGYFPQVTLVVIQSQIVLSNVIEKLNLNDTWGKKYFNGERLKTSESMQILKQRMNIGPVKNTELIYITVYGDDPNEAAQIANAIPEAYRDYRNQRQPQGIPHEIAVLQKQYEEQAAQIAQTESEVESLRQQLKIANDVAASQSPQEQPYWDKKHDLERLTDLHKELFSKIEAAKLDPTPKVVFVEIVDPAVPGKFPVKS